MKTIRMVVVLMTVSSLQGYSDDAQDALSPEQQQFKAALQTFSGQRYGLLKKIAAELDLPVPLEVHPFFEAAIAGDEKGVIKQFASLSDKVEYNYSLNPALRNELWAPIHETIGAYEDMWEGWKKDAELMKMFYEPILKVMPLGSIYFGGTDPGRFMITPMNEVGSSNVFCLTQNALADGSYLSHIRFVYGKQIWIPSAEDSAKAFQQFVKDVQAGRSSHKDALKIQDGRVEVTGAAAVMEINSILARHIFDNNKDKHAFYVEESYTIEWMYPYLEPCGPIMKLTPSAKMTEEVIAKDMAFWKNQIDQLEQHPRFAENPAARKSFAKLRSAIAGLYQYHQMYEHAETAYRQAHRLDPTSPEPLLRLTDMLVKQERLTDAIEFLQPHIERDERFKAYFEKLVERREEFRKIL